MGEKYRKIICPNGHASEVIGENDPLPRRCVLCRQQYLKNTKPIWCDIDGNELGGEKEAAIAEGDNLEIPKTVEQEDVPLSKVDFSHNGPGRRRRRTFFMDESSGIEEKISGEAVTDKEIKEMSIGIAVGNKYCLISGDYSIELSGEGILGRENKGKEVLAVNPLVSRKHCYYIVTMQRGLQIRDAGSLNGTFANTGEGRVAVSKDTGICLKSGDRLWLADMMFEVKKVG